MGLRHIVLGPAALAAVALGLAGRPGHAGDLVVKR